MPGAGELRTWRGSAARRSTPLTAAAGLFTVPAARQVYDNIVSYQALLPRR